MTVGSWVGTYKKSGGKSSHHTKKISRLVSAGSESQMNSGARVEVANMLLAPGFRLTMAMR
jgi:hypothetical protein